MKKMAFIYERYCLLWTMRRKDVRTVSSTHLDLLIYTYLC